MPELVLASRSPRRQELLAGLGLSFVIDAAEVDESPLPGEPAEALVARLSRLKATVVAARHPAALVLAADTVVVLEGVVFGKPATAAEAIAMLVALRSRTHLVHTAVTVAHDGHLQTQLSSTAVTMRPYSDAEIAAYVATGDPLDKAGAYAIQHPIFAPVASWEGCYAGVVGLPLGLVAALLAAAGMAVPSDVAAACRRLTGARCCLVAPQ
ncbi:MAG: Maf family protein, partial [Anaerolineae bacterium]|nr:Maf family protein [Anaerolineae bacterium]